MRAVIAATALVALGACSKILGIEDVVSADTPDGGGDGDGDGNGTTVDVAGVKIDTFMASTGEVLVPADLSGTPVEVFILDGTTFASIAGTGSEIGAFLIPDVPTGLPRTVHVGEIFVVSDETLLDLGGVQLGRPDRVYLDGNETFSVDLGNADPNGTSFEVYAPNLELSLWQEAIPGEVSLQHVFDTNVKIEADSGDRLYLVQHVPRQSPTGEDYETISRYWAFPPFSTLAGQTIALGPSELAVVSPAMGLTIDWTRGPFHAAATAVHPTARLDGDELSLLVVPGAPRVDILNAPTPKLFSVWREAPGRDVHFGAMTFGNPFPPEWPTWILHRSRYKVTYLAPGATTPLEVEAMITTTAPTTLPVAEAVTVRAGVLPIRDPTIAGMPAFTARSGVGLNPLLRWTAPELGTPGVYRVVIEELVNVSRATETVFVAKLFTTRPELRVPPGVLRVGATYYARITALVSPESDLATSPLEVRLPFATADTLTATFAP